ncbi:hypothetical protein ACTMTF_38025 [Nonomuraea sp. ZG12]|uniref:hypothetical protein n=1 Tax=Nonomuraea sp. ZG12 TaxID=3452207 RepID=UPI003F88640F
MINGIGDNYSAWRNVRWHPFRMLSRAAFLGWVVLDIGAYRSGALGLGRSVALGLMSALALGTLKGTQIPQSVMAAGRLCAAFVPLGVSLLRGGPPPSRRAVLWLIVVLGWLVLGAAFGPTLAPFTRGLRTHRCRAKHRRGRQAISGLDQGRNDHRSTLR